MTSKMRCTEKKQIECYRGMIRAHTSLIQCYAKGMCVSEKVLVLNLVRLGVIRLDKHATILS